MFGRVVGQLRARAIRRRQPVVVRLDQAKLVKFGCGGTILDPLVWMDKENGDTKVCCVRAFFF